MEVQGISKATELRLLVERLLAHGAREMAGIVNDPPIDLVRHLFVLFSFEVGERRPLGMQDRLFQCAEPHRTEERWIAYVVHHRAVLHLAALQLDI